MLKNWENNGTEVIGFVTPTPELCMPFGQAGEVVIIVSPGACFTNVFFARNSNTMETSPCHNSVAIRWQHIFHMPWQHSCCAMYKIL